MMYRVMSRSMRKVVWWVGGACVVLGSICALGWYPVAYSDGVFIWARSYHATQQIISSLYSLSASQLEEASSSAYMQKLALVSLINDIFISRRLAQEMSSQDEERKVRERLVGVIDDPFVMAQLEEKTGRSGAAVRKYLLLPEARMHVLEGLLTLERVSLAQWLGDQRKNARIYIFVPGMRMVEGEMIYRQ